MQVGRGGLRWGQLLATRRGSSDSIPGRLDPGTDNPEGWDREKVNQEHPHSFGAEAGSVGRGMLSSRLLRGGCAKTRQVELQSTAGVGLRCLALKPSSPLHSASSWLPANLWQLLGAAAGVPHAASPRLVARGPGPQRQGAAEGNRCWLAFSTPCMLSVDQSSSPSCWSLRFTSKLSFWPVPKQDTGSAPWLLC